MINQESDGARQLIDPNEFEFLLDEGFRYVGDGRSVILRAMSLTKSETYLSDLEAIDLAAAIQQYLDCIAGGPASSKENARILKRADFPSYNGRYVYKFTTEEAFEKYIQKGSFLMSSLSRFRRLESEGSPAGDRFEGETFCVARSANRELCVRALGGFDTLVFSTSARAEAISDVSKLFGTVVLRIEAEPFARRLLNLTGGRRLEVRKVAYSDLKIARDSLHPQTVAGFPPKLTPKLARRIRETVRLPSIFGKPHRFRFEDAVRIAIRLSKDLTQDSVALDDSGLLRFVSRVR